jgi:hypothetical protein
MKKLLLVFTLFLCIAGWAQPTINSFSPTSATVGGSITISGTNFSSVVSENIVFFGGVRATVNAATTTSITAIVPAGAGYQPISVTTNRLTAYSKMPFKVIFTGANTAFTPASFTASGIELPKKPAAFTFADIDGDRKIDMITTNKDDSTISVYLNKSAGGGVSFENKVDFKINTRPRFIITGDVNGDGMQDIISMNINNGLTEDASFTVLLNKSTVGQALMTVQKKNISRGTFPGMSMGDFDLDGKPDIAVASMDSSQLVIYGNSSPADSAKFNTEKKIALSFPPEYMINADMDGDGKTDLLISKSGDSSLYILKNTSIPGNFSFDSVLVAGIVTSQSYNAFAVADFNNDGKPDVAVANNIADKVYIFKNTSIGLSISFAPKVAIAVGSKPLMLSAADLNGDGLVDLIVNNAVSATMSVLKNTSTGGFTTFDTKADFPVSTTGNTTDVIAAIVDIDMNGAYDFVGYGASTTGLLFYQNRMLLTTAPSVLVSSFTPTSGKQGDTITIKGKTFTTTSEVRFGGVIATSFTVVSDSLIKAVISNGKSGAVAVTVTTGTDSLAGFTFIPTKPKINSLTPPSGTTGDLINIGGTGFTGATAVSFGGIPAASYTVVSDSLIKAIVGSGNSGPVRVTSPTGYDSLLAFVFLSSNTPKILSFAPASGLVNSTVTITGNNFSTTPANNIVYFGSVKAIVNTATATSLTVTVPAGATYQPISVTVNKLTAYSSKPFVVTFTGGNKVFSSSSFSAKKDFLSGGGPRRVSVSDLDGDGKNDVIVTNQNDSNITIFRNAYSANADSLTAVLKIKTGPSAFSICPVDLNGDGKQDLVVCNSNSGGQASISIMRNTSSTGSISFAAKIDSVTGLGSTGVTAGDLNGDGKPDLVVASGNSAFVSIFRNTGNSLDTISFAAKKDLSTNGRPDQIVLTDIDGDGKRDMIVSDFGGARISIFRNTSSDTISFASRIDVAVGSMPIYMSTGDLDGDGKSDIAVSNYDGGTISVLKNTSAIGNISFAPKTDFGTGTNPMEMAMADINGDGKTDMAVVSGNFAALTGTISVFRNKGTNDTISFEKFDYPIVYSPNSISLADLDNDSRPEMIVTNGIGLGTISVFKNQIRDGVKVTSFTPSSGGSGTTVSIKGQGLTGSTAVSFGGVPAASFTILSDSLINAVVGYGASGFVSVKTLSGSDSLPGYSFSFPEIVLLDSTRNNLSLAAIRGAYSAPQYFLVSGKRLQSDITIATPAYFQVSRNADTGFVSVLSVAPVNNTLDSTKIYVRFKIDSAISVTGYISISSNNAVSRTITVNGAACDSVILAKASINSITKDSTVCIRDSITLTAVGAYNLYKWSTGDSLKTITIKTSANVSLQVGSKPGCLSNVSPVLKVIKDSNAIPILALTGDTTLVSSSAPNYRWYFNNTLIAGNTSNKLVVKKIGFYGVETSNDKICWSQSNDYPIVMLPAPLVNDSVAIKTYPNPATGGVFNVVVTLKKATNVVTRVTVTDASGVVLLQTNKFIFFGKEIKIPITLNAAAKGTVFIKVDINGEIKTQTVILQ